MRTTDRRRVCSGVLVFAMLGGVAAGQDCTWSGLGGGTQGGFDPSVQTLEVYDDGTGPSLYAGGDFQQAGGGVAYGVAKWDGARWSPLGEGLWFSGARDLAVYDDGSGPALYACGSFFEAGGAAAERIAKWTPATGWEPVGGGFDPDDDTAVAMAVFDDGSGEALYVGGVFTAAGGVPVTGIARWDGLAWSDVGGGVTGAVRAMAVHDDGTGPALYAAGRFSVAGGQTAFNIAHWDGDAWSPVGTGLTEVSGRPAVVSLAVYDDGTGPVLVAGGDFDGPAGGSALQLTNIAQWNGREWQPLGAGVQSTTSTAPAVQAMAVHDAGRGPELFVGGVLTMADGLVTNYLARWNGSEWAAVGDGLEAPVYALTTYDDGGGRKLYAGGAFIEIDGDEVNHVARLDGCAGDCLADLDGDGELTFFDFLVFQILFDAGDFQADFDRDGELTIFDFLVFQNIFVTGCP